MTKEETIAILRGMTKYNEDEDAAIFAAIQALSRPSLPSNLDEAAIDFADKARKDLFTKDYAISSIADYDHGCIDGFKAGARWRDAQIQKLPEGLDEAANKYGFKETLERLKEGEITRKNEGMFRWQIEKSFRAGSEWMAGQGWIGDGSMPPETKQEGHTLQGHREWTESEPVLAWDSLYGCRVDWTKDGKWVSERMGGYTGQVCHGIVAWRPIPKYKEKQ